MEVLGELVCYCSAEGFGLSLRGSARLDVVLDCWCFAGVVVVLVLGWAVENDGACFRHLDCLKDI